MNNTDFSNMKAKEIVVVIGSGRSGTSILMQILHGLGMSVSENLIQAKEQTPTGAYEDTEILKIQNRFISELTPESMPVPPNWFDHPLSVSTIHQLQGIVQKRMEQAATLWGFKDPRTAFLIPMWTKIFNNLNITPKYILTVRNPKNVVSSMKRQYNSDESTSELFWLTKNTEALYQTGGNCFIVHYEDWFSDKGSEITRQLLQYTGLGRLWDSTKNASHVLPEIVKPNLNRAVYTDYEVKNRHVTKLYEQLAQCNGENFNRRGLMDVVMDCRKAMDEFSGWVKEAQKYFQRSNKLYSSSQVKKEQDNKIKKLEAENYKLVNLKTTFNTTENEIDGESKNLEIENEMLKNNLYKSVSNTNALLKECKNLNERIEELRITISTQNKENKKKKDQLHSCEKQLKISEQKFLEIKKSTSFQLGLILVNALAKPGKNTIMAPLYLLRLFSSSLFLRKS
jgi:hypothetical protein